MKECQRCLVVQDDSAYVADERRKDKLYPYCKSCAKVYYQSNRERLLAQKREYGSRPDVKEKLRVYNAGHYLENKETQIKNRQDYYSSIENRKKLLLWKSKERATQDNIEHTISIDDIVIPEMCPYLDIQLTHSLGKGQLQSNSSIDRIDSTMGYIPGNVQVISRLANTMKSNATPEQLLTFAKNLIKIHK